MNGMFGQPRLPPALLRDLVALVAADPDYDPDNGGQWVGAEPERTTFQGIVLPMSDDDRRTAPQGTYTKETRKIYTNGYELRMGMQVCDPMDGATYTVTGDLDHGAIHSMRRFTAERKGKAAPK